MFKTRARLFAVMSALVAICFSVPVHSEEQTKKPVDIADQRQWLVARMASSSPPGRSFITGAKETPEEGLQRYGEIADAIMDVAYDPSEKSLFPGKFGRARTAAVLASIALFESAYRRDVDLNIGPQARGDGGRSWCMVQVQLGNPNPVTKKTSLRIVLPQGGYYSFTSDPDQGLGGEDLISDRRNCFRAGLRMVQSSFLSCRALPLLERLSQYTSGNCQEGRNSSKVRVGRAVSWVADHPPPLDDATVRNLLSPPPVAQVNFPGPLTGAVEKPSNIAFVLR